MRRDSTINWYDEMDKTNGKIYQDMVRILGNANKE